MDPSTWMQLAPGERAWLWAFALGLARVLPVVALTPAFGVQHAPRTARTGVALLVAAALAGSITPAVDTSVVRALVSEALVGLVLAVVVAAFFESFATIGALHDGLRGASIGQVLDPAGGPASVPLAIFMRLSMTMAFLTLGGPRVLIAALGDSFAAVPPGAALSLSWSTLGPGGALEVVMTLFVSAVALSMPALLAAATLDLGFGIVERVAGKLQIFFLSMGAKSWFGIAVAAATVSYAAGVWITEELARLTDFIRGGPL